MCTCEMCRTIEAHDHRAALDDHPTVKEFVEEFLTPLSGASGAWMVRGVLEGRDGRTLVLEKVEVMQLH